MIVTKPDEIKIGQKYKSAALENAGVGGYIYMGCGWKNPVKKSKHLVIIHSDYPEDIGRMVHCKSNCAPSFWEDGFEEIED